MTPCDPDNLTAFVDGSLDPADAHLMEDHLRDCARCAAAAQDHLALRRAITGLAGAVAVPPGLAGRVRGALDSIPPPAAPRGGWSRWALPAGFTVLVATLGLWLAHPFAGPQPVDVQALMWHHRDAMHPPRDQSLLTDDRGAAARWIAGRLAVQPSAPALKARLRGVGVCRVDGAPAAIWMYSAARPVSLIEIFQRDSLPAWETPPSARLPAGLRVGAYAGYNAVIWRDGGHTFALVSDMERDRLLHLVETSGP
jgi:anti-sigma factor RsiW